MKSSGKASMGSMPRTDAISSASNKTCCSCCGESGGGGAAAFIGGAGAGTACRVGAENPSSGGLTLGALVEVGGSGA